MWYTKSRRTDALRRAKREGFMRVRRKKKKERQGRGFLAAAAVVLALLLAGLLAVTLFQIREAEVTGNSFYTEQEIRDRVISDRWSSNSLYLYLKYKYMETEEIPFVDKIEISLQGPGKVRIRVYEKSIVGYVAYMGSNFYFDQDGVVVECSSEVKAGVPCISGLKFSSLALYQKLAVQDDSIFSRILTITQLVKKYDIKVEKEDMLNTAKNLTKIQFAQYGMINVPEEVLNNYANEMLKKQEQVESLLNRSVENKLSAELKKVVKLNHKAVSVEDFNKMFA